MWNEESIDEFHERHVDIADLTPDETLECPAAKSDRPAIPRPDGANMPHSMSGQPIRHFVVVRMTAAHFLFSLSPRRGPATQHLWVAIAVLAHDRAHRLLGDLLRLGLEDLMQVLVRRGNAPLRVQLCAATFGCARAGQGSSRALWGSGLSLSGR